MKQYRATLKQEQFTDVTVNADTLEEAEALIRQGEGEPGQTNYSDETEIIDLRELG